MGEAWFMGSARTMYPQLCGDLAALPDHDILQPLEEITSGSSSFGPRAEWTDWYHYLLPRVMMRQWAPTYFHPAERLISAFMNQHSDLDGDVPYPEFRIDALDSLGRAIMAPHYWRAGPIDTVNGRDPGPGPGGPAGWTRTGNLVSASLFFCAKYLRPTEVGAWFRAVVTIPDRYWRVRIIAWLTGAHPILTGAIAQPAAFPEASAFDVAWDWSHAIKGGAAGHPFLPPANREAIVRVARGMAVETFLEDFWSDPMTSAFAAELAGLPEHFLRLYRSNSS
jgi:hypothetical protein